ncbi:hypothetical protein H4Q26_002874 [Puccinia striiformis f. sp. tritici PST-130]|nr:hypothetical protein H4Q26_002874 [Puccinia striiformis f. sp. tritici PST-130]
MECDPRTDGPETAACSLYAATEHHHSSQTPDGPPHHFKPQLYSQDTETVVTQNSPSLSLTSQLPQTKRFGSYIFTSTLPLNLPSTIRQTLTPPSTPKNPIFQIMGTPRSISPDSLQSSMSCVSGQSMGSTRSGQSTSVTIHPTLFIRDSRRKNHRNAPTRLQLTESDFGFRSPTSLSTKIKRLLSSSALLPKAIFNRHPQSQASVDQSSLRIDHLLRWLAFVTTTIIENPSTICSWIHHHQITINQQINYRTKTQPSLPSTSIP